MADGDERITLTLTRAEADYLMASLVTDLRDGRQTTDGQPGWERLPRAVAEAILAKLQEKPNE